jgi:hypothetical protein
MGLAYNTYLNSSRIYGCKGCKTHLANHDFIISRVCFPPPPPLSTTTHPLTNPPPQNIPGQHGKANQFNAVVNIETGDA